MRDGQDNTAMQCKPVIQRVANFLSGAVRNIDVALMPKHCVFCGMSSPPDEASICSGCYADLPRVEHSCGRCASPVSETLPEGFHCGACQASPPPFVSAIARLEYAFPTDAAIKAMKFNRRLDYVPAFASLLIDSMADLADDIDALVAVPLHWHRQAARGFNQAEELCKPLMLNTGLPILGNVRRTRATPYQSALDARHRHGNLESAFGVRGKISARHVLVVDDVITTGETCGQLARVLLENGVERVSVLAIARA
jgi:ComF family protein